MKKLVTSLILFTTVASHLCFAGKQHGISMHGDLKYKAGEALAYANPNAPKGGQVRLAVTGTFDSTNPFITKGTPPAGLSLFSERLVFESLMKRSADEPFSLYGLIAEFVEVAPDRSWITFYLNPKAKWPDGKPITADDVLFSHQTLRDKGRPNLRLFYSKVATVQKIDDRTIKFTFKPEEGKTTYDPELPLLIGLMSVLPKHLLEGKDFEKVSLEPMVGSGPYRIKEINPGKHIIYERREDWWGKDLPINAGAYNFNQVRFDFYRDPHVAFEAFKAGEYDIRSEQNIVLWHTSYDFPAVSRGQIKRLELIHEKPVGMHALAFNIRRPIFQDIRVREALGYAFDFNWLNKNLFYGAYTRTCSFFQGSDLQSRDKPEGLEAELLQKYADSNKMQKLFFEATYHPPEANTPAEMRQNLAHARTLLREAGWTVDNQGKLKNAKGEPFRFELLLYNPDDEKVALALARNLKLLGVQMDIRVIDTAQFEARRLEFDYDMIIQTWGQTNSPGNEQTYYWGSEAADQSGSRNYIGLKDTAVDALCKHIAGARTREELVAAGRALDRLLLSGHYVIPLYHLEKGYMAYWDKFDYPTYDPKVGMHLTTWWAKDNKQNK